MLYEINHLFCTKVKNRIMRVLLTKEFNENAYLQAEMQGIKILYASFIAIEQYPITDETTKWFADNPSDCWVFTSAAAAQFAEKLIEQGEVEPPKKIFAIGRKTAEPLATLNVPIYFPRDEYAHSLADFIIEQDGIDRYCHFRGNISLNTIEAKLKGANIAVISFECYKTTICKPAIDENEFDGIVFYSPSAVKSCLEANLRLDGKKIFAIGQTTASMINKTLGRDAIIPEEKNFNALIQCIKQHI